MKRILFAAIFVAGLVSGGISALASNTIVISEFRFRGPAGGNDEFVELLNISTTNVDITGWKLVGSSNTSPNGTRATNPPVVLAPGEHFLYANAGYTDSVWPNVAYTSGFSDNGGVAITTSNDVIVDAVGVTTTANGYREGTPLPTMLTVNTNQSYMRKANGTQDTDDNSLDFQLTSPSQPQNRPYTIHFESVSRQTNGIIQLQCVGVPLKPHELQASTNVGGLFSPITTNTASADGTFQIQNIETTNTPMRFYRLMLH
jgi:predicted extracellular nuclease